MSKQIKRFVSIALWTLAFLIAVLVPIGLWLGTRFQSESNLREVTGTVSSVIWAVQVVTFIGFFLGVFGLLPGTRRTNLEDARVA